MNKENVKVGMKFCITDPFSPNCFRDLEVIEIDIQDYVHWRGEGVYYISHIVDFIAYFNISYFELLSDEPSSKGCVHEMKEYLGFTARYNYCTKCDHKEEL